MRSIRIRAFGKINLSLRVLGIRPDGYHELRTVFQSIALHDTLHVTPTRGRFEIVCSDPRCPTDRTNLVAKAAGAVWRASGRRGEPRNVRVQLRKKIPIAAGVGGGSSDAAAALRAFAALWELEPSRIPKIAAKLGADVPYFLIGGTVLGLERGDLLYRLAEIPPAWIALAVPAFGVSTRQAYAWLDADRAPATRVHRTVVNGIGWSLGNDLQTPVAKRHPEIRRIVATLHHAGAVHAAMTGSGSAVFGLFDRESAARKAAESVNAGRCTLIVTRTLGFDAYRRLAGK
jgi:4-diphosphocytidyl-2-C-methyl-D-erythritol kinase